MVFEEEFLLSNLPPINLKQVFSLAYVFNSPPSVLKGQVYTAISPACGRFNALVIPSPISIVGIFVIKFVFCVNPNELAFAFVTGIKPYETSGIKLIRKLPLINVGLLAIACSLNPTVVKLPTLFL